MRRMSNELVELRTTFTEVEKQLNSQMLGNGNLRNQIAQAKEIIAEAAEVMQETVQKDFAPCAWDETLRQWIKINALYTTLKTTIAKCKELLK